eukprot:79871-Pleurochrysis_carterae.AAC.1
MRCAMHVGRTCLRARGAHGAGFCEATSSPRALWRSVPVHSLQPEALKPAMGVDICGWYSQRREAVDGVNGVGTCDAGLDCLPSSQVQLRRCLSNERRVRPALRAQPGSSPRCTRTPPQITAEQRQRPRNFQRSLAMRVCRGRRYNVPRLAFVNKLDREGASPDAVIEALRSKLRLNAAPMQAPPPPLRTRGLRVSP